MSHDPVAVDEASATSLLESVGGRLPKGWRIMPIGGLGMMKLVRSPGQLTRDVDLVPLIVVDEGFRVPSMKDVEALAHALSQDVHVRKDQASVAVVMAQEAGPVKLELIRGRNAQSGGYFVTRRVLEAAARLARREGAVLYPPAEVLAFLKAWAAVDQSKLVDAKKDPAGFHRDRAQAFRNDVSRLLRDLLGRQQTPVVRTLETLLVACPDRRAAQIRKVLREAGWGLAPAND